MPQVQVINRRICTVPVPREYMSCGGLRSPSRRGRRCGLQTPLRLHCRAGATAGRAPCPSVRAVWIAPPVRTLGLSRGRPLVGALVCHRHRKVIAIGRLLCPSVLHRGVRGFGLLARCPALFGRAGWACALSGACLAVVAAWHRRRFAAAESGGYCPPYPPPRGACPAAPLGLPPAPRTPPPPLGALPRACRPCRSCGTAVGFIGLAAVGCGAPPARLRGLAPPYPHHFDNYTEKPPYTRRFFLIIHKKEIIFVFMVALTRFLCLQTMP